MNVFFTAAALWAVAAMCFPRLVFCNDLVVSRSGKVVLRDSRVFPARGFVFQDRTLVFHADAGNSWCVPYDSVRSVFVAKGNYLFWGMLSGAAAFGAVGTSMSRPGARGSWIFGVIGMVGGAAGGAIFGALLQKPPELVYYNGEWKVHRYRPGGFIDPAAVPVAPLNGDTVEIMR